MAARARAALARWAASSRSVAAAAACWSASRGSVARGLAVVFQALCGGVGHLLLDDLVGDGGVFGAFGGGRRGSHGGAAQQRPARVGLGARG